MRENRSVMEQSREHELAYDDAMRRELQVQQQREELRKAEERERQRLYKETLDKQREMKQISQFNFGSMT